MAIGFEFSDFTKWVTVLGVVSSAIINKSVNADQSLPPANCTNAMNAYCNGPTLDKCIAEIKVDHGETPLIALFDRSSSSDEKAWRCYSPTCIDNGNYKNGSNCKLYCSEVGLEDILDNCTDPAQGREIEINATDVWGQYAVDCHQIRTPELVKTPSNMLLIGQCRHANASQSKDGLGDDMRDVRIVTITSIDNGKTWGNHKTITAISRSVAVGIYDKKRDTIVLQYQSFTSSNPYTGNFLWQMISMDRGETWGPETNITQYIAKCNQGSGGQVCGAAGSRLQTTSGRLVFSGHEGSGNVCVWYSDDGGETYTVSESGLFTGNEQSIADLYNGSLYMNGRGTQFPWAGHRVSYWSHDDGTTWGPGVEAKNLLEPNTFGCDGSVISVPSSVSSSPNPPRVFFAEPHGPSGRISLRVWCSVDGGVTWGKYVGINKGKGAAYSALEYYTDGNGEPVVLVVWEQSPTMLSYQLPVNDWCPEL